MRYLHTMVRIRDLDESLDFWVGKLGLVEVRRIESEQGRFTLIFLCADEDEARARADLAAGRRDTPMLELTYNWTPEDYGSARNFGHLAYEVDDIYAYCKHLQDNGVTINRPPRDGRMAFVKSPDGISIELLQKGGAKEPAEAWKSAENIGTW